MSNTNLQCQYTYIVSAENDDTVTVIRSNSIYECMDLILTKLRAEYNQDCGSYSPSKQKQLQDVHGNDVYAEYVVYLDVGRCLDTVYQVIECIR